MRRLKLLPFILLLLFAFISCKVESDDLILGDAQANYKLYEPYIDEYGNKGVIACITRYVESGELAEVIVLSADETEERWGPMDELVYQAEIEDNKIFKSQTYGLGVLQSMKAMGINRFPAQKWCDAKNEDEEYPKTDSWRLPTYYELRNIFNKGENVQYLNTALQRIGGTTIDMDNVYWTCVEDFEGYIQITNNGVAVATDYDKENRAVITTPYNSTYSNKDKWLKKNKFYVRAIKYIHLNDVYK